MTGKPPTNPSYFAQPYNIQKYISNDILTVDIQCKKRAYLIRPKYLLNVLEHIHRISQRQIRLKALALWGPSVKRSNTTIKQKSLP